LFNAILRRDGCAEPGKGTLKRAVRVDRQRIWRP
jgi:hypothetical protein